jgi:ABC-2 type transport system permease protein
LFAPMEAQNLVLRGGALLFPILGLQAISMGLAGTDLAQHRDFVRAAEAHRRGELKIINDDILFHPVKAGEVHNGDHELWAKVPRFEYEPPSVGSVAHEHSTALILLAIWLVAAAILAWRSATRLRPL